MSDESMTVKMISVMISMVDESFLVISLWYLSFFNFTDLLGHFVLGLNMVLISSQDSAYKFILYTEYLF